MAAPVHGHLQQLALNRLPLPHVSDEAESPFDRSEVGRTQQSYESILSVYGVEKRGKGLQSYHAYTRNTATPLSAYQPMTPLSTSRATASRILRRLKANASLHRAGTPESSAASTLRGVEDRLRRPSTSDSKTAFRISSARRRYERERGKGGDDSTTTYSVFAGTDHRSSMSIDVTRGAAYIGEAPRRGQDATRDTSAGLPLWRKLRGATREVQQRTV